MRHFPDEKSAPTINSPSDQDDRENRVARAKYLNHRDIQQRKATDPICAKLPIDAQAEYLSVRGDVCKKLVQGLSETKRWQDLTWNGQPKSVGPHFQENDLDHVVGLLEWAEMIAADYPDLYQEICNGSRRSWMGFLTMIIVHDIGEIGLGDVVLPNQDTEWGKRKKRVEPILARRGLRASFSPEQYQSIVRIYDRFEDPAVDDKLAQAARFMDKAQASGHVAKDIIPFNLDKPDYVQYEFSNNLPHTLKFASMLMENLQSRNSKMQLFDFVQSQVMDHFDKLEFEQIDVLRERIRLQFPIIFSENIN